MNTPLLIGFGYRARRGKDVCAAAIIAGRGDTLNIKRIGFADALKEEVAGKELELCLRYGIKYEPDNKHRTLLQWYGSEYRRAKDMWYWVKQIAARVKLQPVADVVLIPDVRFLNEAYWIKANGGFLVKVERTGYVDVAINASHVSELELTAFKDWDYTIEVGDGDIAELQKDALYVFDHIIESLNPPATDFSLPALEGGVESAIQPA